MPDFRELLRQRLRDANLPPAREAEIIEELAQHLGDRYDSLRSSGATDAEAQQLISAELDQRDLAAELRGVERRWSEPVSLEAGNGSGIWSALWQDVRYAVRVLRLNPGFTIVCVLSLALGIGANTAIFQLIDAVRMRALPVKNPQELALIRPIITRRSGEMRGEFGYLTNAMWQQVRAHQQGFGGVFAFANKNFNLARGGQARYAVGMWVSGEFFDTLGIQPLLGRLFHAADDHPGCGTTGAVISYPFWQREFGGDPGVLSKTVTLDGHVVPVIGVTPAGFYGLRIGRDFDVAVPLCSEPFILGERSLYSVPHGWWLTAMGRLKPGWSMQKASAQLQAISPAIMEATLPPGFLNLPDHVQEYLNNRLSAFPGATGVSSLRREYETPLWVLLAIASLVLLIACANLANLMLARAAAREREIAVRLALGAARGRLVRQLLTESLLLGVAGALLGTALARVLSRLLVDYLGTEDGVRIFLSLGTDWRVLLFTTGLALLTCVLFGLAPALKATSGPPARISSLAGRGLTATRERFSLRRALVVSQVALSLVLVVSALLFAGSLRKILTLDAGFQRDGILVMDLDFSSLNLPSTQRVPFTESMLEHVRSLPGVEAASEVQYVPLSGDGWNGQVIVEGKKVDTFVDMNSISDGYFKTLGTPLLTGRDFDQRDTPNSPRVAIVNQQFARRIFGGENAVGRTFKVDVYRGQQQPEYQIVGMVKNTKYMDLREELAPIAFYPQSQNEKPGLGTEVMIRSNLDLQSLVTSLRHTMADINPAIAIDFEVFNQQVKDGLLRERLLATLSGSFGVLAVVLATVGLYGVIAYMVVRRTNEIGIRMALGATPGRVLAMVLSEASTLLLVGLPIGVLLSLAAGKAAMSLLFGVRPYDPIILTAALLGLSAVAIAASLLPARRAARLHPMVALREE